MSLPQQALQPLLRLPSHLHKALRASGKLLRSSQQESVLPRLDALTLSLSPHSAALRSYNHEVRALARLREAAVASPGRLHGLRLLLHGYHPSTHPQTLPNSFYDIPAAPAAPAPPKGVYLVGDVGSGKTLLLDLLFACSPLPAGRLHFHDFMRRVYQAIHVYDALPAAQRAQRGWGHPLDAVLETLPVGLLAFDEFQVADVADARLMHGVFERLHARGTVVCATANRRPEEVNRSQLRDEDFRPMLELLYGGCDVVGVEGVDYRGVLAGREKAVECYFGRADERGLRAAWERLAGCKWDDVVSAEWDVGFGRSVTVDRFSAKRNAVQVTTEELLERPLAAADYRAIARNTEAIFFVDVLPAFSRDARNLARRFITLVDVAYEEKVRLVMRMETDLDGMFEDVGDGGVDVAIAEGLQFEGEVGKEGVGAGNRGVGRGNVYTGEDERFAFRRAVSRLREMRTASFGRRALWE